MENQTMESLAEKIAFLLRENQKESDDFLCSSLDKINQRLDDIETQIEVQSPKPEIRNPKYHHFSQEKFLNLEELADEIINGLAGEKICPFEPAGKPCDHCSMCSSRGF